MARRAYVSGGSIGRSFRTRRRQVATNPCSVRMRQLRCAPPARASSFPQSSGASRARTSPLRSPLTVLENRKAYHMPRAKRPATNLLCGRSKDKNYQTFRSLAQELGQVGEHSRNRKLGPEACWRRERWCMAYQEPRRRRAGFFSPFTSAACPHFSSRFRRSATD